MEGENFTEKSSDNANMKKWKGIFHGAKAAQGGNEEQLEEWKSLWVWFLNQK